MSIASPRGVRVSHLHPEFPMTRRLFYPTTLFAVVAVTMLACGPDMPTGSPAPRAPLRPALTFNADFGSVRVCNYTGGDATYQATLNGVAGSPFTLPDGGTCANVFNANADGQTSVTVRQLSPSCPHLVAWQIDEQSTDFHTIFDGDTDTYTVTLTTTNGVTPTGYSIWFKPGDCQPPPPEVCTDQNATNYNGPLPCIYPGKTFTIGPSSMEGAILISNGDWVNGGYSFKFKSNTHLATNFTVNAFVTITGPCIGGGPATDTFSFPLKGATYAVPAGNTSWLPTGDANNVLSWQGSVKASGVCGGIGKLDARKGAVFTATVSQNPPSGSLVDFRFKYRDPAAKGKPNTNCLDTSDPNRAKADVCGASWSQTVTDP